MPIPPDTAPKNRPSLSQRRASRSLSLSMPASPLCMVDPTDTGMKVSPSLYAPSLICSNLYLGSQHSLRFLYCDLAATESFGSNVAVLNVAEEIPPLSPHTASAYKVSHYLHIPMSHAPDLSDHLPKAMEFIDFHVSANRPVLVHCMCGVSRSAAIVLAYLMCKLNMGFRAAYEHVKLRRDISPNMNLVCQLVEFGIELGVLPTPNTSSSANPPMTPAISNFPSIITSGHDSGLDQPLSTKSYSNFLSSPNGQEYSVAMAAESGEINGDNMDHQAMDHVDQLILLATNAANTRVASHFMAQESSDKVSGAPLGLLSPVRQNSFRKLSASTPLSSTLNCIPSPSLMTSYNHKGIARHPSISSLASIAGSITCSTNPVSPRSAMLDAFPLTDPDLMLAARRASSAVHYPITSPSSKSLASFPLLQLPPFQPMNLGFDHPSINSGISPDEAEPKNSILTPSNACNSPLNNPQLNLVTFSTRSRSQSNPMVPTMGCFSDTTSWSNAPPVPKLPEMAVTDASSRVLKRSGVPPPLTITTKCTPSSE